MTYSAKLSAAHGDGRLVRRPDAVLFIPDLGEHDKLIDAFLDAPSESLDSVLADHVLERTDTAPGFAAVFWPEGHSTERVKVVARGTAAVSSDIASMPVLSGAGSTTWVEHRVIRNPPTASVRSGAAAITDTDLRSGVISAGGFHLSLRHVGTPDIAVATVDTSATPVVPEPNLDDPETTITAPALAGESGQIKRPIADVDPPPREPDPDPEASPAMTALEAAAGADWMEESLQLGAHLVGGASATTVAAPIPNATASPAAAEPSATERLIADELPVATHTPVPPVVPGDEGPNEQIDAPLDRVVSARLCRVGHPNSPHDMHCRTCGSALDFDQATTTVEQPALALLGLPDGSTVAVSGDVVLGRNPAADIARLDVATLIMLEAPSSVSRTHLTVSVDGWRIHVTDCGSRAGSALVIDGEHDPVPLEAWMPHEVSHGDRIFLGGPTAITINEVPAP